MTRAEIGVFGGSGFYSLLDEVQEVSVSTPYGPTSDSVFLGEIDGVRVAFLPRHGRSHTVPPHRINYRANVWAMKELGVSQILAPCACGSLKPELERGDIVLCDQYVDRTKARPDTYYDGPTVAHVASGEPFCPRLRGSLLAGGRDLGYRMHEKGTVVVIEGPRFSTKAESRWFAGMGWDVVNMTAYPEVHLAREMALCYSSIAVVTDYDAGLADDPSITAVTVAEVLDNFARSISRLRTLLFHVIPRLGETGSCSCSQALEGAIISG